MKLIRFGEPNRERPGLLLPDGRRIDAAALGADYDEAFFGSGGLERLARWLGREGAAAPVVADGVRLGPPLCRPSKIVCVGLHYRDHARESGMAVPVGPFLAAADGISDIHDLRLWLRVNGATKQWSSPPELICDLPAPVCYISQFMTLLPGAIFSTAPPPGVGPGQSPPRYLVEGDEVE